MHTDLDEFAVMPNHIHGIIIINDNGGDNNDGRGVRSNAPTPRLLIKAIGAVTNPEPGMTICDSACGTGGFFIASHDYLPKLISWGYLALGDIM